MKTTNKKQDAFIASLMPDSDKKMVRIASVSLIVALALGFWASTYERIIDEVLFDTAADPVLSNVSLAPVKKDEPKKDKVEKKHEEKVVRKHRGGGGPRTGKGEPKAPEKIGVLKYLAANTKKASNSAFDWTNQKFAKDIDHVLTTLNSIRTSGKTTLGATRGKVDGGFNEGRFGGGSGGIGDGMRGLLGGAAGRISTKSMKGKMAIPSMKEIDMGAGGGSRSASDIMKIVRQRTPGLRHIYNKHLKKKPGFQGKVTLKFTIAPSGDVISNSIVNSTTGYGEFDSEIKNAVSTWRFGAIKSGNTTVTIPFTFTE